eukprot:m.166905 g.166905  ORF g.166905 m.166905 type:complete len:323 (+) comp17760_c0_seq3:413-1381(+)
MAATFDSLFHDAPTDRADVVLRSNDLPRQLRQCQEMVQEQERNFENSRNVAAVVCDCRRDATWQVSGGNNFKLRHLSEMVSWLCKLEMLGMPEFRALNQFLQEAQRLRTMQAPVETFGEEGDPISPGFESLMQAVQDNQLGLQAKNDDDDDQSDSDLSWGSQPSSYQGGGMFGWSSDDSEDQDTESASDEDEDDVQPVLVATEFFVLNEQYGTLPSLLNILSEMNLTCNEQQQTLLRWAVHHSESNLLFNRSCSCLTRFLCSKFVCCDNCHSLLLAVAAQTGCTYHVCHTNYVLRRATTYRRHTVDELDPALQTHVIVVYSG